MPLSLRNFYTTGLTMHMPRSLLSGNKERDKIVAETMQKGNQFWYETGQAVVQSTFDVQDRSLRYVQNSFADGIETLKSHIEALQIGHKPQDQQEAIPSLMENGVEACKRNIALLQRVTEHGAETFRTNAEVVRDLTQTLTKKAQDRQPLFSW